MGNFVCLRMIQKKMTNVYFEAERLKYKNVGLYYFCKNLGNALVEESLNNPDISFQIYGPKHARNLFNTNNFTVLRAYHKLFRNFQPKVDIWHCTYQFSSYIPNSKYIKTILTVHDLNFLREKTQDKQRKYLKRLQQNIDKVDVVVCISNFVLEELKQNIDLKSKKAVVIYNGSNIGNNHEQGEIEIQGLDLEKPFLFFVGAILPKKNIRVLPYLLKENNFNLIIAGQIFDEKYKSSVLDVSRTLDVEDRVFFTGAISESEKVQLLQKCSFFCFPSLTEGFGLPVVEAMSFGKPLILSNATSLPEIAGETAFYFENFEPDYLIRLGAELINMKQSEEQRNKLIERSQKFSWKSAAIEYWKIYKEFIRYER